MATTTGGTTYVTSTDLVADYPTASLALANRVDVVASGSMSKKTASYTVTVGDILAGTTIAMNSASATVITLPSTSLVNGMRVDVFSVNTGAVTFAGGTVTGTVNSITSQYSGVSLTYDSAASVWWCLPFGGGSASAIVSGTTGSPTVTTSGSTTIYTFTGNGSISFSNTAAAYVEALVCGGGGGTAADPGGGGGVQFGWRLVSSGTYAVTVGAGGTSGTVNGGTSSLGSLYTAGGGLASNNSNIGFGLGGGQRGQGTSIGGGGAGGNGTAGTRGAGITWYGYEYGRGGIGSPGGPGVNYGEGANGNSSPTAGRQGVVIVRVG